MIKVLELLKNGKYKNKNKNKNNDEYKYNGNSNLNEKVSILYKSINKLNEQLEKARIYEITEITGNSRKMLIRNFTSGIFKGFGVGIGFYLITALVLLILNYIIKLNIPIIGDYIADIIQIVELNK